MRRREFLALAGVGVVWPLCARAQQRSHRVRRIGVLMPNEEGDAEMQSRIRALLQGLEELGWVEGRNVQIDYRWAGANLDLMSAYAAELVALNPEVIVCQNTPVVAALLKITRAIPIVFAQVSDPVGNGFVDTLARPGGNVTGFTNFEFSIGGKWPEILHQIDPQVTRVAVIFNPATAIYAGLFLRPLEAGATSLSMRVEPLPVHDAAEIERGITRMGSTPGVGLVVMPDAYATTHRDLIISLAARHRLPAMYPFRYYAASGGLISYGIDAADATRRSASYVDRILRGEKPADLPVQQPTKFELVINLKTAKALGLTVPPSLLARADEVIE